MDIKNVVETVLQAEYRWKRNTLPDIQVDQTFFSSVANQYPDKNHELPEKIGYIFELPRWTSYV